MKKFLEGFLVLTAPQWVLILSAVAATVLGAYTAWLFNQYPGYLVSFVCATGLTLIADRTNNLIFQNNTKKDLTKIIKEGEGLHIIGGSSTAIDLLHEKRHGAKVVFNTVFDRHSAPGTGSALEHCLPKFLDTAVEMIKNGCVWHDIYTEENEEDIRSFRSSVSFVRLSETEKARYRTYRVETGETPMLQCLVMKYSDDDGYVFFGWTFRDGDESRVFGSAARDNVRYFAQFFTRLILSSPDNVKSRASRTAAAPLLSGPMGS